MSKINFYKLEKALNYVFKNKDLLIEALSHPSLRQHESSKKHGKDYERLEFLGDSILSFIISENLFEEHVSFQEGDLAKARSYLVCKQTISSIGIDRLSLADYIIMTIGEEISHGRENLSNIENVVEALIAAIYLDSGDIKTIKNIVNHLWSDYLDENIDFSSFDPKSALQELVQSHKTQPHYTLIDRTGPAHAPFFTVTVRALEYEATATAQSIKEAEKLAAKQLLNIIHSKL